jgi:hypothetical protein
MQLLRSYTTIVVNKDLQGNIVMNYLRNRMFQEKVRSSPAIFGIMQEIFKLNLMVWQWRGQNLLKLDYFYFPFHLLLLCWL